MAIRRTITSLELDPALRGRPLPPSLRGRDDRLAEVARIEPATYVLGRGRRRGLWLQGCGIGCPGCVVPESHPAGRGREMTAAALVARLLDGPPVAGLTISGGEPTQQPAGLTDVIRGIRMERPEWTVMLYTGHYVETLLRRGTPQQIELLRQCDLVVDGPYIRRLARPLLWRGSANQRVIPLSERGLREIEGLEDVPAGMEIALAGDGGLTWTGVPHEPGFREALDEALRAAGAPPRHGPAPELLRGHDAGNRRRTP